MPYSNNLPPQASPREAERNEDKEPWTSVKRRPKKERKELELKRRLDVIIVNAGNLKYSDMLKRIKSGKEIQARLKEAIYDWCWIGKQQRLKICPRPLPKS